MPPSVRNVFSFGSRSLCGWPVQDPFERQPIAQRASGRVANRSTLAVGPRAGSYWADRRDGRRPIGHRDSLGLAADLALGIVSTIAFGYRAFVGTMLPAGMPAIQTPLSVTVDDLDVRIAGHGVLPSKPRTARKHRSLGATSQRCRQQLGGSAARIKRRNRRLSERSGRGRRPAPAPRFV